MSATHSATTTITSHYDHLGHTVNVTVITAEEIDYGTGPARRWVFVNAKYTTDAQDLHVFRDGEGTIASFPQGSWVSVVRHSGLQPLPEETGGE